jgi:hypothetical protein
MVVLLSFDPFSDPDLVDFSFCKGPKDPMASGVPVVVDSWARAVVGEVHFSSLFVLA